MDASDPIRPSKNSCGTGAVHIWVPAFAGTTRRRLSYFFAGAILESAGLAASGLASVFAAFSSGLSMRSTFAASHDLSAGRPCERYYPAFQFVVWAGKSASEAMSAAMFDTEGEA